MCSTTPRNQLARSVLRFFGAAPAGTLPGRASRLCRVAGAGALVWLTGTSGASACPVCVVAALDSVIPPIVFWSVLALTWFFSLAVVSSIARHQLQGQPRLSRALIIGVVAVVAAGGFLGPLGILPLALPPAYASIRALRWRPDSAGLARVRKAVLLLWAAHTIAAIVGLGLLAHTFATRTEGEYICKWSGTGPARGRFKALLNREPESIDSYRYLVERCSGWVVADAVKRIGQIGDPVRDGELLRRARPAAQGDPDLIAAIEDALATLEKRQKSGPE